MPDTDCRSIVTRVGPPCDLLARYGGEEFMAVLPDTNANTLSSHMIGAADRALYKAKHSGRNRVASYGASRNR